MGGRLVYKVVLTTEISRQMDEAETALSARLKARTGVASDVQILNRSELNVDGIGYSNFFLFSEEWEGEEVYFQVHSDPLERVQTSVLAGPGSGQEQELPRLAFVDRLFTDFSLHEFAFIISPGKEELSGKEFFFSRPVDSSFPFILVPPPEAVA